MPYSPQEAAQRTGFSIDTLRYYERIGLLDGIDRGAGGHRIFSDGDLAWLEVLRCLRDTGMPIARMKRYADLARHGDATFGERIDLLAEHHDEIDRRIETLRAEQRRIADKLSWYRQQVAASAAG